MNKADEKELASLHGQLAKVLKDAITDGTPVIVDGVPLMDKDGNFVKLPATPAILNVARQFLKDNKIEAISIQGTALHDLADLPVFEDDNVIPMRSSK